MYIINFNFILPIDQVNQFTEAHRKYVSQQYSNGMFIIGGPKNPRNGGIVLANTDNKDALIQVINNDPLILNKAAEYTLLEFNPLMSNVEMAKYV